MVVLCFSGSSLTAFSGDGGQATSAGVSVPTSVCGDSSGTVYITSGLYKVLKIDSSGIITPYAGTGVQGTPGADSGPATSAQMRAAKNCALDTSLNLYLSLPDNQVIKAVSHTTKDISRFAGNYVFSPGTSPGDGGPATSAVVLSGSIYADSSSNIYSAEYQGYRVRKISVGTNIITNYAGKGVTSSFLGGMGGQATSMAIPGLSWFISADSLGNTYVASDTYLVRVDGSSQVATSHAGKKSSFYFVFEFHLI